MSQDSMTLSISDQNKIVISEGGDGIVITNTTSGAKIVVGPDGIVLDNGRGAKLTLTGASVDINSGAFKVD